MTTQAPQLYAISKADVRNVAVDFQSALDATSSPVEVLTGTPTVLEQNSPNQLTLSSKQLSNRALSINGRNCPTARAVQFTVNATAASVDTVRRIVVTCGTNRGQTLTGLVQLLITE